MLYSWNHITPISHTSYIKKLQGSLMRALGLCVTPVFNGEKTKPKELSRKLESKIFEPTCVDVFPILPSSHLGLEVHQFQGLAAKMMSPLYYCQLENSRIVLCFFYRDGWVPSSAKFPCRWAWGLYSADPIVALWKGCMTGEVSMLSVLLSPKKQITMVTVKVRTWQEQHAPEIHCENECSKPMFKSWYQTNTSIFHIP